MKRSNTVDGVSVDSFAVHLAIKSGEVMTLTVLKREFNADTSTNFYVLVSKCLLYKIIITVMTI